MAVLYPNQRATRGRRGGRSSKARRKVLQSPAGSYSGMNGPYIWQRSFCKCIWTCTEHGQSATDGAWLRRLIPGGNPEEAQTAAQLYQQSIQEELDVTTKLHLAGIYSA